MPNEYFKTISPALDAYAVPDYGNAAAGQGETSVPWTDRLILGLLMLAVLGVSLFFLSKQSLRLDEAQSIWQASHTAQGVLHTIAEDVTLPLYPLLLHFWIFMFGDGVGMLRLMSLLFFLATIPAIYFLGLLAYDRRVGLAAAAFTAVSPFLNWYGNEIRTYSLMVLLAVLNHFYFLSVYKRSRAASGAKQAAWWLGYALTGLLGVYTHYLFWFLLLSQALFFLFYRRRFPAGTFWGLALTAIALLAALAPWAYYVFVLIKQISNSEPMLLRPHLIDLFNVFSQFLFGFQDDHLNTLIIALWPLAVVMAFLSLRKKIKIPPESVYFFIATFFPILAIFALSVTVRPIFLSRYLIFSVPSLYLFLIWLISTYPKFLKHAAEWAVIAGMAIMLAVQIYKPDTPVKEDYRGVSAYLSQNTNPQDIVVISSPFTIYPIEYYYAGTANMVTLPIWDRAAVGAIPPFSQQELLSDAGQIQMAHQKAYLVLSYDQGYQKNIKDYFDSHFPLLSRQNFSPGLNVYVYDLQNKYGAGKKS